MTKKKIPEEWIHDIQENGPRNFLYGILERSRLVEYKRDELRRLRGTQTGIRGINYDTVRVQTSGCSDGFSSIIDKLVDKELELAAMTAELIDDRDIVIDMISVLRNPVHCDALYKYYIEGKTYEQMMAEMSLSYDSVRSLVRRAVKAFGEWYGYNAKKAG